MTAPACHGAPDTERRTFGVGPVTLSVEARDPRLFAALHNACDGYVERPSTAGRVALHIEASLDAPVVAGLPELPRLLPIAAATLVDESEGFSLGATVAPGRLDVVARLRDYALGEDLLRRQLEGLMRVAVATAAPLADAALVHGCALVGPRGDATLFLGASGDGKTTMARRLPGHVVLADDTALLARLGGSFFVMGTPFAGKEGLPRLGALTRLSRVAVLAPREPLAFPRLPSVAAFQALLSRAMWFAPAWPAGTSALVDLLGALSAAVPVHRLSSTLEDDVTAALAEPSHPEEPPC